jgi:hypothetical protein
MTAGARGVDRLAGWLAPAVLLFWGCWLAVVTASNVTNALRVAQLLPGIGFASSNFELIETTVALYAPPRALVWVLFLGVIFWEALAAALYLRAFRMARRADRGAATHAMGAAALAGMALFAAFMLADELCIAYPLQATHMRTFIAQGVSWLVARAALAEAAPPATAA